MLAAGEIEGHTESGVVAVDLFCGAGGLTHGLRSEGVRVAAGYDLDPACAYPFSANNGGSEFVEADVGDLDAAEIRRRLAESRYTVLAGCAPCQAFSRYTQRRSRGRRGRWHLLDRFGELARNVGPDVVTMENVPDLARQRRFDDFVAALKKADYEVHWEIAECAAYGAPQNRKRLVLLASLHGRLPLLTPLEFGAAKTTVRDAIGHLRSVAAGETDPHDLVHRAASLQPMNLERVRASRPGGTWRDWPEQLRLECHRKPSGTSYPSVYGRMRWEAPAPTITTLSHNLGSGRFGHPDQDRALTPREAALLQTFPPRYRFEEPGRCTPMRTLSRLIGNAVPVVLGRVIGRSIRRHLDAVTSGRAGAGAARQVPRSGSRSSSGSGRST
ncbi:DNA cytosine methyltransferase [Craurococcus roseus]|uniref:DNA (cytosine-5-)-methyltransferase n=1 Tax=Craurococcus roseus TaxID=77585 RepID=A0ABN1FKZ4_9PROT